MKRSASVLLVTILFVCMCNISSATTIDYQISDLGSGRWQYSYDVSNDTAFSSIDEFTIYFDYGLYANLSIDTPKAGWDEITIEPDLVLGVPAAGAYDALALSSGIAQSGSESGFAVSFDWLGTGTPGSQYFEVVDSVTFETLDSGNTTAASVPEPSALLLLVAGCPFLVFKRRLFK